PADAQPAGRRCADDAPRAADCATARGLIVRRWDMSIIPRPIVPRKNDYPTSDGKPMAETDRHRLLMEDLIRTLDRFYRDQKRIYVTGNLLLFYEKGDKRKHLSPDVMVVKGVPKRERLNYLVWQEGKAPQFVIELTSSSTRREDTRKKYDLYRDTLKVKEYF